MMKVVEQRNGYVIKGVEERRIWNQDHGGEKQDSAWNENESDTKQSLQLTYYLSQPFDLGTVAATRVTPVSPSLCQL